MALALRCHDRPARPMRSATAAAIAPARPRAIRAGERLYRHGDAFTSLFVVCRGAFKLEQTLTNGSSLIAALAFPQELLGSDALSRRVHRYDAIALQDAQVQLWPSPGGRGENAGPCQTWPMLGATIDRQRALRAALQRPADARLAYLLHTLSERIPGVTGHVPAFTLPLSRDEIAVHLGVVPATVSRALARLQNVGLIRVRVREVCVLDPAGLARCAGVCAHAPT